MHIKIFQVWNCPVPDEEYIDEGCFSPEEPIYSYADYFQNVDKAHQREERMRLKEILGDTTEDEFILEYSDETFMRKQFKRFLRAIKEAEEYLSSDSADEVFSEFVKPYGQVMHFVNMIKDSVEDKTDPWVCDERGYTQPLARWMRDHAKGTYHLGGVVSFHR